MLPRLHARLLYLFVTPNALLQKRRGQSNKNMVSIQNNLLPCLSPARSSSLRAAVALQRWADTFGLQTEPLLMRVVHNSLQVDQDEVTVVGVGVGWGNFGVFQKKTDGWS